MHHAVAVWARALIIMIIVSQRCMLLQRLAMHAHTPPRLRHYDHAHNRTKWQSNSKFSPLATSVYNAGAIAGASIIGSRWRSRLQRQTQRQCQRLCAACYSTKIISSERGTVPLFRESTWWTALPCGDCGYQTACYLCLWRRFTI